MPEAESEENYFLVQVSGRGSENILKNNTYRNPRWAHKRRDKPHGLVKPGDLLVIYFAGGAINYQRQLRFVYKVNEVSADHVEFKLEKFREIDKPLTLEQIRRGVIEGSLSVVFRNCGLQGFNICKISPAEYESIFEVSPPEGPDEATISLERDLENFLFAKLDSLEKGLKTYKGETGRQFHVGSGRIDILAQDKDKNFVVIELKAGTASESVLTQILAYMADVTAELSKGKTVRGIIVAYGFAEKLVAAATLLPMIKLMKYKVSFEFEEIIAMHACTTRDRDECLAIQLKGGEPCPPDILCPHKEYCWRIFMEKLEKPKCFGDGAKDRGCYECPWLRGCSLEAAR